MTEKATGTADPRSMSQLVADAVVDARQLIDHQRALATQEMKSIAIKIGIVVGLAVTALVILFYAAFAFVIFVGELLVRLGMPPWAAYLLDFGIGVFLAVAMLVGAVLVVRTVGPPRQSIAAARQTVTEVQTRLRSFGRG